MFRSKFTPCDWPIVWQVNKVTAYLSNKMASFLVFTCGKIQGWLRLLLLLIRVPIPRIQVRVTAANKNKKKKWKPDQVLVNEQDESHVRYPFSEKVSDLLIACKNSRLTSCGGLNADWDRVSESSISYSLLMANPAAKLNKSLHVYVFSIWFNTSNRKLSAILFAFVLFMIDKKRDLHQYLHLLQFSPINNSVIVHEPL